MWHYQKANIENIRKAIDQFQWAMRFANIDVNEKVNLLNKTIKNIIRNYIPHKIITCDDRDPPWINKDIKELIHEKNQAYKSYRRNKKNIFSVHQFELLQSKLNFLIEKSKPKKIPCIPPLLHEDKFITNFKEKADIFNDFIAKQCSLININSSLPSVLSKKTHKLLSTIHFTSDDILKIINNLDLYKAHGHDMISIQMIKICDASICKPLELIFTSCLENGKFPTE